MEELKKYFSDLLILQYKNKPRAKATIEALVQTAFSDTTGKIFPIEIQNSYNLDTATGEQLDILGKYLGRSRVLALASDNTFKYATYDLSSNPETGYSDYYEQKNSFPYAEYRYSKYSYETIENDNYRLLLKMLAFLRGKPLTLENIDLALETYFGGLVYVIEKPKELEYHIANNIFSKLSDQVKLEYGIKHFFPKPMGCSISAVRDPMFLNLIPYGGAENFVDENFVFTRETASQDYFFMTPMGFDINQRQKFEMQIKVKIDSAYVSSEFYFSAIDGEYNNPQKTYDFGFEKRRITGNFALIDKTSQGQVQYIDITSYSDYIDNWITLKLTRDLNASGFGRSLVLTIMSNGTVLDEIDTHWGMNTLKNAYFVFCWDFSGSIDFKECWASIDNNLVWQGVTNKRVKGV